MRIARNALRLLPGLVFSACLATAPSLHAALNDVFPTDFVPNAVGANTAKFFLFDRSLEGPYVDGARTYSREIRNNAAALQLTHFAKLGNYTVSPFAVVSWGSSETTAIIQGKPKDISANGFGDLRMGGTIWLYSNPEQMEHVAVTAHVIAPTGSYDATQILNVSENRWKYVLGAGWVKPLSESLHVLVAPEVAIYGKNDQFNRDHTLEQSPSYSLTGYMGYRFRPSFYLSLGGQINRGGETRLDGVDQDNPVNSTRYSLGVVYFSPERKGQWILRYAREANISNGFRLQDEIALRYGTEF